MNPEIIGITSSCIILLAGCMQSEKKLRIVDVVGSLMMAVYGVLIHAPSVIFLNASLMAAHIYRLIRIERGQRNAKRNASEQP